MTAYIELPLWWFILLISFGVIYIIKEIIYIIVFHKVKAIIIHKDEKEEMKDEDIWKKDSEEGKIK